LVDPKAAAQVSTFVHVHVDDGELLSLELLDQGPHFLARTAPWSVEKINSVGEGVAGSMSGRRLEDFPETVDFAAHCANFIPRLEHGPQDLFFI
jgi:hypothetical protein